MNVTKLHEKLIAAGRKMPADERVPYAFEQRIMSRLASTLRVDPWVAWGGALWRAAVPCLAIMALCGIYSYMTPDSQPTADFSQEFESVVFASARADEAW